MFPLQLEVADGILREIIRETVNLEVFPSQLVAADDLCRGL